MRFSFFKKTVKSIGYIFNVAYVLEKYWYVLEMLLNFSWILISKIAGYPVLA